MKNSSSKIILLLSGFLILDPFLRILSFKISTGMDWALIWDNIVENGNVSVFRFMEFWIFTPLAGLFLLTLSRFANIIYSILTLYKFYSLMTYTPYDWPYFAARPHFGAFCIITVNLLFVGILMWPLMKKYIFSYHFKDVWDARGRYETNFKATLYLNGREGFSCGRIKNISSGGALLNITDIKIPMAKPKDEGILIIETFSKEHLYFDIELVNTSISPKGDMVGMEFVNMGPKISLALLNILIDLRASDAEKEKRTPSEVL